jgi:hypothetical protein
VTSDERRDRDPRFAPCLHARLQIGALAALS